jgi:hypothetical protein
MALAHAPAVSHSTEQSEPPQVIAPQLLPPPQTIEQLLAPAQLIPALHALGPVQSA